MRADAQAVLPSAAELLAGAEDRQPLDTPGKSGARLERVRIDGAPHVVKHLVAEEDWTMRAAGVDLVVPVELWRRGILAALPDCIHQPIVGVAEDGGGRAVLLMEDVSAWLVPTGDAPIPEAQNARFLAHMAAVHAEFWEGDRDLDVVPPRNRYLELSPSMGAAELARGSDDLVPRLVREGWPLLAEVAPRAAAVVTPLAHDPGPLVAALATTPQTFVHGNWKLDNLGSDDAGRTVLFDWELSGRGAATFDLAWYLAINCRRLPVGKEACTTAYRQALEGHGIATEPWWDRQLALSLLGGLVSFGWEKALGGYDEELAWWEEQALRAAPLLP
jgi:hypothetical protein